VVSAALLALAAGAAFAAGPSQALSIRPDARAVQIAQKCQRPSGQLAVLEAEAKKIKDPALRRFSLEALKGPSFPGLMPRRSSETAIARRLFAEGLLDSVDTPVFPTGEPMPFFAAPGGTRLGHHSYPGGLTDHTLFNLRAGLGLADAYEKTYDVKLDRDLIRAAAIRHDAAKAWTLTWQNDGAPPQQEAQLAATGAHHVLGVAEAVAEGFGAPFVVVLASAHVPPHSDRDLDALTGILRAAAIIAGKPYTAAGLTPDGRELAARAPLEAFISHLDDHDWVLTETTLPAVVKAAGVPQDFWALDAELCKRGDIPLYRERLDSAR
jgi:hypothetical protein